MLNELLRRMLFLPPQASTVAREIDYLHYFVILTTMGGAATLTLLGISFLVRFRARAGSFVRERPAARPPLWAEIMIVGGLLSLFCLWWVIGFLQYVKVRVPPEDALPVYVTAKQWMWKFAYPDGEHTIATLYVPSGRPVKLLLTSRDVIHSFYVPDFRIKQDVLPGRYTTIWFEAPQPGSHMVLCAEYCGTGHSMMRAEVIVLSPADYGRWLAGARRDVEVEAVAAPALGMVRVGVEAAASLGCLRCHTLDGSPHIGPTWASLYGTTVPLQGGGSIVADEAYLTESMMDPMVKLHAGFAPVMPTYHGIITPGQVSAIIELIKSERDVPAQGAPAAPAGVPAPAPATIEGAGAMESAPVQPPPLDHPLRPVPAAPGVGAPAVERGLPPPGRIPNPKPRLPIRVEGKDTRSAPPGGAP